MLLTLLGLQAKHFAGDYLLQSQWMLKGKSCLTHPGGYAHAGIHVVGTLIVLAVVGVSPMLIAIILAGELCAHYAIDYAKARWSLIRPADLHSRSFWAAQGADQFMHQLTYAVILFVVMRSM